MKKLLLILICVLLLGCFLTQRPIPSLDFQALDYIHLPDINSLTIDKEALALSQEDLNSIICMNLSYNNVFKPISNRSTPERNDIVKINLDIKLNGNKYYTAKETPYFLDSLVYPKEFEQKILAMTKGSSSSFDVRFPSNYANPELAGQAAQFTVQLCDIVDYVDMDDTKLILEYYGCVDMTEVYEMIRKESNKLVMLDHVLSHLSDISEIDKFPPQGNSYIDHALNSHLSENPDADKQALIEELHYFYKEFIIMKAITETEGITYTQNDLGKCILDLAKADGCSLIDLRLYYDELSICYELLSEDVKNILYETVSVE